MDAFDAENMETARELLDRDPEILTGNHDGAGIPLLAQTFAGSVESVCFLLERGALVDKVGQLDMTPLHWAAACGYGELVQELLRAGADPSRLNALYASPHDLAQLNGHEALGPPLALDAKYGDHATAVLTRMGCL